MRTLGPLALALMLASALLAEEAPPTTVTFPSGNLQIKAFFWKPAGPGPFPAVLFNHGSGGEDAAHTAGLPITEAAEKLAPIFLKHGYAFLYPFRRGQGLSADQARFMQDVLNREEKNKGKEARQHLQFVLLTTEQLDDAAAGLNFLKSAPGIDPRRLAVIGHSFGGQLSLLVAERDPVRAVVTFAGAAASWEHSPELRDRLLAAVGKIGAPIMMIQAENDYSTAASHALGDALQRLHKPYVLKIDPPVGDGPEDGHNELYRATTQWEGDVFKFLDQNVK